MASKYLTLVSGTASSEEDFMYSLDNMLVGIFGWERVYKHTDTSSNVHYSYRSAGENPGDRMPMYVSFDAFSNLLILRGFTYIDESTGTQYDEMFDFSETRITLSAGYDYFVAGNKDFVTVNSLTGLNSYQAGLGYFNTPYTYKQDPYPIFVFGQGSTSDTFLAVDRLFSYVTSKKFFRATDGVAGGVFLSPSTTVSGASDGFRCFPHGFLQHAAPHQRDGRYYCTPVTAVLYKGNNVDSTGVRGTLPYMWNIWGDDFAAGSFVSASGINLYNSDEYTDEEFFFIRENGQDDNSKIVGPIIKFDESPAGSPYLIGNVQLYLSSDTGISRRGGSFTGGRVSSWRDKSQHPTSETFTDGNRNDASQATDGNQPTPIDNVVNNLPSVRFNSSGSNYLSGTLDVDNDMTIFTVASYSNGSSISPVISVRGDVSATDTSFSIQFNEDSNNSVSAINIAGGGTDKEVITGLSANTMYILTNTVSGTTTNLYVDGAGSPSTVTNAKGLVASSATLNYSLGVDLNSGGGVGSNYSDIDVAEVLVFDKYLTNEERQTILCYLAGKYNITVTGC